MWDAATAQSVCMRANILKRLDTPSLSHSNLEPELNGATAMWIIATYKIRGGEAGLQPGLGIMPKPLMLSYSMSVSSNCGTKFKPKTIIFARSLETAGR